MSSDPGFADIFDDLVEENEDERLLLANLADLLPDWGCFLLLPDGTRLDAGLKPEAVVPEWRAALTDILAAATAGREQQAMVGSGYLFALPSLPAALLLIAPDQPSLIGSLLANTVNLALLQQERFQEAAEKEQLLRQINALKVQHGQLIEDNYRQYRQIQEKDKNYAATLESEIARQTAQLREANARLEETSRLKSEFLANMSHELRTPMNAIIGFSELLTETSLDRDQTEYATTIRQAAASLLALINDILDLAKIEAGKLELEKIPFDFSATINNVVAMFVLPAREKGVEVSYRVDPAVPGRLRGDGHRLRQVLINLVGNAMKFTDQGRIELTVQPCPPPLDGAAPAGEAVWLEFAVHDTGIGIPADRIDAIFEKFTQADGSTTRRFGGTGLGLSICQQLVQLMGGEIKVESEPGRGSTFSFRVSLGLVAAQDEAVTPAPVPGKAVTAVAGRGRILLVEDNLVNQRLATIMIGKQGYELEVAGDGLIALEWLKKQEFDLVLMDVQMPNMDGMTATRTIREIEADPDRRREYAALCRRSAPLPIVGLTAHARKEDEEACYAAGMSGFLSKPIARNKLATVIAAIMSSDIAAD